jgi:hypothetical protein
MHNNHKIANLKYFNNQSKPSIYLIGLYALITDHMEEC